MNAHESVSMDVLTWLRLLASGDHGDATALMATYATLDELKRFMAALGGLALLLTADVAAHGNMTADEYLSAWTQSAVTGN